MLTHKALADDAGTIRSTENNKLNSLERTPTGCWKTETEYLTPGMRQQSGRYQKSKDLLDPETGPQLLPTLFLLSVLKPFHFTTDRRQTLRID